MKPYTGHIQKDTFVKLWFGNYVKTRRVKRAANTMQKKKKKKSENHFQNHLLQPCIIIFFLNTTYGFSNISSSKKDIFL